MNTVTYYSKFDSEQTSIQSCLHELTSKLISTFASEASANRSFFVNDIPAGFSLSANLQMLAAVLGGLLAVVVTHTKDSCIRLTAKTYGNVVLVQLLESASSDVTAIGCEVRKLQPIAEKMFGSVSSSYRNNLATVCFGFVNMPMID